MNFFVQHGMRHIFYISVIFFVDFFTFFGLFPFPKTFYTIPFRYGVQGVRQVFGVDRVVRIAICFVLPKTGGITKPLEARSSPSQGIAIFYQFVSRFLV